MTSRKKGIPGGLLILPLLFLFLMMPGQVKAAQNSCEVTIPVQIEVSGDKIPDGETYQITMEAVTKDAPMPAQNVQERKNAGSISFGPMTYTVPEIISIKSPRLQERQIVLPMIPVRIS